jgi:hypothetical protein
MSLLLGYSFSSNTEISIVFSNMEYLLAFFVVSWLFLFCLFLGILVKRSAFALVPFGLEYNRRIAKVFWSSKFSQIRR